MAGEPLNEARDAKRIGELWGGIFYHAVGPNFDRKRTRTGDILPGPNRELPASGTTLQSVSA